MKKEERIIELVYGLAERTWTVEKSEITVEFDENYVDIRLCKNFHHRIYLNEADGTFDTAYVDCGCGYNKDDLEFSAAILGCRDEIIEIVNN